MSERTLLALMMMHNHFSNEMEDMVAHQQRELDNLRREIQSQQNPGGIKKIKYKKTIKIYDEDD